MIKHMMDILRGKWISKNQLQPNKEVHDLRNKLASVSGSTTVAAKEYKEVMKKIRRNDITFQIGVVTGNVRRN